MAIKKRHLKAMKKIMKKYKYFNFKKKKEVFPQFLEFLSVLAEDEDKYFENISFSMKNNAIEVEMADYEASYPLEKEYGNNIDYTDFISRYLY